MRRTADPVDPADRLVTFVDAVAAIALTLLALPLVDLVPQAHDEGLGFSALVHDNLADFGAFLLSFAVIFRFWWAHHRLFRHVSLISPRLVGANVVWMLSIVFLPVPTAVIVAFTPSAGTVLLYCGTLVLTSGSLTVMALTVQRDPRLSEGRPVETREEVLGNATALGAQLAAAVVGSVFASTINYWALTLMLLTGPVEAVVKRRWRAGAGRG